MLLFAIVLPAAFYILFSSDWAQETIRSFAQEELSKLLGTEVTVGHVALTPFNRLHLCRVAINDDNDSIAAEIREIDVRIEVLELITSQRLVIDYASITGLDAHLYRATAQSPLNIRGIINHINNRPKGNPQSKIYLTLNNLSLRDAHVCYNITDVPPTPGRFDPSHISLSGVNLTIYAPQISNDCYTMELQHFSAHEQSGFVLSDLGFNVTLSSDYIKISNFHISLPSSRLRLATLEAGLPQGLKSLSSLVSVTPIDVRVEPGSTLYLPDFKAFQPAIADFRTPVVFHADATVSRDSVLLRGFSARTEDEAANVMASGSFYNLRTPSDMEFSDVSFQLDAAPSYVIPQLRQSGAEISAGAENALSHLPKIRINGTADGHPDKGQADITISSALGSTVLVADYTRTGTHIYNIDGHADFDIKDAGSLIGQSDFSGISAHADIALTAAGKSINGKGELIIDNFEFKSHTYRDIAIEATLRDGAISASARSDNPDAIFHASAEYAPVERNIHTLSINTDIVALSPYALSLTGHLPDYTLSSRIDADLLLDRTHTDTAYDAISGSISISDFALLDNDGEGVSLRQATISLDSSDSAGGLTIDSDLIKGEINGYFVPQAFMADVRQIAHNCMPELQLSREHELVNDFVYDFTIDNAEPLCEMLSLPVMPANPLTVAGYLSAESARASIAIDAPWLIQGDKIIENTVVSATLDGANAQSRFYATTFMPTKKGPMSIIANINGRPGNISTNIDWQIQRAIPINGKIGFNTAFSRADDGSFAINVDMRPGTITFGQDVWQIAPSGINYFDKSLQINNFSLATDNQQINIATSPDDLTGNTQVINLRNVNLIEIFETLEINNALIGGNASGEVLLTDLFSEQPKIYSPGLHVTDISYNYCTIGDADVKMRFDNEKTAFILDADVVNPQGLHSRIFGSITPATEELDITFLTNRVKVGFLKPFMKAFASDIRGYASGRAHLFGTFKHIDLEGDVFADSVQVRIDFTNTWYTATDSLHMRPGVINLEDITITDVEGNKAMLNGSVRHTFFSAPVFDFAITDAKDFLCYNVPARLSPDWYGKIYGDGSAHVHGVPGVVDISVNMATQANSTFTFVLSDTEVADEYSFIEFRDATPVETIDSITEISTIPYAVLDSRARQSKNENSAPTAYNLDIQVDVTPQAQVVIVMDPVGGDRIRAYGAGNLRVVYGSVDNDLRMYGAYTLERGNYNFTLQDIIIKDFTIQPGSSISFRGDPYSAQLDLQAVYAVNANLSDLDESFLSDKDLNRTNVPVHAVMKVTGDMRQPSVNFDLSFPTLTSDTYRKVRSIVSTDEMMNRQIIYLLALNKFYTPDYMASATRSNELFSVASATIGSQLSNMLGKLSDNWSIAPNLRSERGDFSDIEVDLTLSSALLNNRLLFNGNLGYRDKSLNTNRFVGDFDIEYLLNNRGTWRLKAYNRYNDQNYYLRTALTTQGIGIMYRRDFDRLFNFLKPRRNEKQDDKE